MRKPYREECSIHNRWVGIFDYHGKWNTRNCPECPRYSNKRSPSIRKVTR